MKPLSDKQIGTCWEWWMLNADCHAKTEVLSCILTLIEERACSRGWKERGELEEAEYWEKQACADFGISWDEYQKVINNDV